MLLHLALCMSASLHVCECVCVTGNCHLKCILRGRLRRDGFTCELREKKKLVLPTCSCLVHFLSPSFSSSMLILLLLFDVILRRVCCYFMQATRLFCATVPLPFVRHWYLAAWLPRVIQLHFNYIQHPTETALPPPPFSCLPLHLAHSCLLRCWSAVAS